jgi:hypothetical protein
MSSLHILHEAKDIIGKLVTARLSEITEGIPMAFGTACQHSKISREYNIAVSISAT